MTDREPAAIAPSEEKHRLAWEKEHADDVDFFEEFETKYSHIIPKFVGEPRTPERKTELDAMIAAWDKHIQSRPPCPDAIR